MKKQSIRILKISLFFTLFASIFIFFYITLNNGIYINNFNINNIKVNGFYLSLDKKLILKADSIVFDENQNSDIDIKSNVKYIKNIHIALQYFQQIEINSLKFSSNQLKLTYDGRNLYLDSKDIYLKMAIDEKNSKILVDIEDLFVKKYNIYYQANGSYDINKQLFNIAGDLKFWDVNNNKEFIDINLNVTSNINNITIRGYSNDFKDIKFLRNMLPKANEDIVDAWIYDNYSMETARIKDFYINIPLNSKNILSDTLETLYVTIEANNGEVKFHENLDSLKIESIDIIFQKNNLEFYPKNASYKNHKLVDSNVVLADLTKQDMPTKLKININTNTKLDTDIIDILKAYDIHLPIIAQKSNIDSNLFLDINFKEDTVYTKGLFKTNDNEIVINGIPIQSKITEITLNNKTVIAKSTDANFKNIINADLDLNINLNNKNISGDILVHQGSLSQENKDILYIENTNIPFNVDFQDEQYIFLNLPTFDIAGIFNDAESRIEINSISKLKDFSKLLMEYKIIDGSAKIITNNFKDYQAVFDLQTNQELLLDKLTKKPLEYIQLSLAYHPEKYTIRSSDSKLRITNENGNQNINLNNVILNINKENLSDNTSNIPIFIKSTHSDIILNNEYHMLSDNFDISIINNIINMNLRHKNGVLKLIKNKDKLDIDAREFGDEFINTLGNKTIFHNGRFYLKAHTNDEGILLGEINFSSTSLNNLSTLQNIFAFIDSVPSLLSFKMPGFNDKGYYIDDAIIIFGIDKEYVAIDKLDFNGSSMDIKGKGLVSIGDKSIDFHAQLITAKHLAGIINKIPGVNYILLGEDGNISTNFRISGTIDNPKIHTQATKDALIAPFNILKRTITSPFDIFKK